MGRVVKRKTQTALITLVITIVAYSLIFFDNDEFIQYGLILMYSVGIFCGGFFSLGIDYIVNPSKYRFIYSLILHILTVLIVQKIFWIDHFWEPFFIFFLPVGLCFFLIDELIRNRQYHQGNK